MLTTIIKNYQLIVNNVGQLIEMSGYRNDYLSEKIGLKPANFSLKKQKGNWSADELLRLFSIIENDEIQDFIDALRIEEAAKGKFVSSEQFEKEMGWK